MGESKARQRPGPWERARPRVHQHAPPRAELKKMRPQAGGIFDMSGAGRTRRHPRAGALPGTLGFLIGVGLCRAKERSMAVPAVQRLIHLLAPRPYEL